MIWSGVLERMFRYMREYSRAIDEPKTAFSWNLRGISLSNQGKHIDAINAFDKAIEIAPGWDLPGYNKSILQNPELNERALIWKNSQKRDVISDPRPNWGGKKYILDVQPG